MCRSAALAAMADCNTKRVTLLTINVVLLFIATLLCVVGLCATSSSFDTISNTAWQLGSEGGVNVYLNFWGRCISTNSSSQCFEWNDDSDSQSLNTTLWTMMILGFLSVFAFLATTIVEMFLSFKCCGRWFAFANAVAGFFAWLFLVICWALYAGNLAGQEGCGLVGCDYGPGFVCVVTAWLFVSIAIFVSYFALLLPSPQMTAERISARTRTTAPPDPPTKEPAKTVEHL